MTIKQAKEEIRKLENKLNDLLSSAELPANTITGIITIADSLYLIRKSLGTN